MKLLACIAFHYSEERLQYIHQVVENFKSYPIDVDIVVDTNISDLSISGATVNHHTALYHPFQLTWKHRQFMIDNIDKYDYLMYIEDDMLLPYESFDRYVVNYEILFPKYIPSFIRIEEFEGEQFITDAIERQPFYIYEISGKEFITLKNPYHAFWIMKAEDLKNNMLPTFTRLDISRETAASFPIWELGKKPLIEINNKQIIKECYSYHLPNNYARSKESPFAKIKPENIFL